MLQYVMCREHCRDVAGYNLDGIGVFGKERIAIRRISLWSWAGGGGKANSLSRAVGLKADDGSSVAGYWCLPTP